MSVKKPLSEVMFIPDEFRTCDLSRLQGVVYCGSYRGRKGSFVGGVRRSASLFCSESRDLLRVLSSTSLMSD